MTNTIYCTYLTIYSGSKLPPLYIGSTSIEKINNGYRGTVSSKKYRSIWKSELAENPQSFETIILTYHSTREEAFEEEVRLQESFDVVNSPLYMNMAIANKKLIFNDYDDLEWRRKQSQSHKGKKLNTEYKKKLSEAGRKRYENPDERYKTSESAKRGWTEEAKRQRSIDMKKRYESEEARKKTSESIKGSKRTQEQKKRMSEAQKNRKPDSEETKKKRSESAKKRCESVEARKKMSEAAKISWEIRNNIKK